jgi:hypothetical protein
MAKNKVTENTFKKKHKVSLGRHAKKDSLAKGSKRYKKPYAGQGR